MGATAAPWGRGGESSAVGMEALLASVATTRPSLRRNRLDKRPARRPVGTGSLAHSPKTGGSARDFRDFVHFREFVLRNQERGEKCKKLATTGVQTPGRPPEPSPSSGRHRTGSRPNGKCGQKNAQQATDLSPSH